MNKVVSSAREAVADIAPGSVLTVGGFGVCGVPFVLITALLESGADRLTTISNNCGIDGAGLGLLLESRRVSRTVMSFVGGNKELARQYMSGELDVELTPQGSLAERLRAGGCGIPAFYTPAGVGTMVADGGIPIRYGTDGSVTIESESKETRTFGGQTYVLETALTADFGLIRAKLGDRHGNLVFDQSARNFNPLCAMAARTTIVEVERLVEPGEIPPDAVHLPGVFVQRVVEIGSDSTMIERRTTRPRPAPDAPST